MRDRSTLVGDLASTHGTRNRNAKIYILTQSLPLLLRVSAHLKLTATIDTLAVSTPSTAI